MSRLKLSKVMRAFHEAAERAGIFGEVQVELDGNRSISWIGKPSPNDLIVTVSIRKAPRAHPHGEDQ